MRHTSRIAVVELNGTRPQSNSINVMKRFISRLLHLTNSCFLRAWNLRLLIVFWGCWSLFSHTSSLTRRLILVWLVFCVHLRLSVTFVRRRLPPSWETGNLSNSTAKYWVHDYHCACFTAITLGVCFSLPHFLGFSSFYYLTPHLIFSLVILLVVMSEDASPWAWEAC